MQAAVRASHMLSTFTMSSAIANQQVSYLQAVPLIEVDWLICFRMDDYESVMVGWFKIFLNGFTHCNQREGLRDPGSRYYQRLLRPPYESITRITQNYDDKIWDLDGEKVMAIGGESSDILAFGDYVQKNLAYMRYKNGHKLSTEDTAQFVRS